MRLYLTGWCFAHVEGACVEGLQHIWPVRWLLWIVMQCNLGGGFLFWCCQWPMYHLP